MEGLGRGVCRAKKGRQNANMELYRIALLPSVHCLGLTLIGSPCLWGSRYCAEEAGRSASAVDKKAAWPRTKKAPAPASFRQL